MVTISLVRLFLTPASIAYFLLSIIAFRIVGRRATFHNVPPSRIMGPIFQIRTITIIEITSYYVRNMHAL